MDESVCEKFKFFNLFVQAGLMTLICNRPEEMFPKLVMIFYSNINHEEWVIKTNVCKHEISLCLKDFVSVCDLPYSDSLYYVDFLESNDDFDYLFASQFVSIDQPVC